MGFWSETFGGGNSFSESVANATTRDDDYEYRGGNLYDISGGGQELVKGEDRGGKTSYGTLGQADSKGSGLYYPSNVGGGEGPGAGKQSVRNTSGFNAGLGSITRNPIVMGSLGLMSGGIGPALMSGAMAAGRRNRYNNTAKPAPLSNQQIGINKAIRSVEDMGPSTYTKDELKQIREGKDRIEGSYYKDGQGDKQFKMGMFGNSYEINPETGNSKLLEDQAAAAGNEEGIATVRPVGTQVTAPTSTIPTISTESEFAKQPMVSPPAEWLIANGYADTNPSYDALVKYNTDLRAGVLTMSEGGRLGQTQMQMSQIARKGAINPQTPVGGLQQYGTYLDNRYGDPEFDQKRMQFLREVGQQEQQTFGGGGGGSFPSSGLGGKGGAGSPADRLTQPLNELTTATDNTQLIENGFDNNVDPVEQAPTNSLYKGLSPVFGGAMGGARAALGMAEGGDVQFALGGNEKDLINAMEDVIRRDLADDAQVNPEQMSDQDKIVVAQYVQQYGESALMEMVNSVKNGTADETRRRFARGENGMVRGNGDGSGTDDKITAQLKDGDATQDVLLADGEFVLRKDATQAIEKKYGGGALDKINDAGPDAAKELRRLMPT